MKTKKATKAALDAQTPTATTNDGKFVRTALVIGKDAGSVDVLDKDGRRRVQLNIFVSENGGIIVDVIDVENRYAVKRALGFSNGERSSMLVPEGGKLVSVDFRVDDRG